MRARTSADWWGRSERGASLPETVLVLALAALVGANGLQALEAMRRERAGREAARGVASDLRALAQEARRLRRTVAVEFDLRSPGRWRVVDDGNGNGVTSAEIEAGVDRARPWSDVVREGQAVLDVPRDLPAADGDGVVRAGSPAVSLGTAPRLTFTPRGTASSASIYLVGPSQAVYAVRVLGTTQRIRLSCLSDAGVWEAC